MCFLLEEGLAVLTVTARLVVVLVAEADIQKPCSMPSREKGLNIKLLLGAADLLGQTVGVHLRLVQLLRVEKLLLINKMVVLGVPAAVAKADQLPIPKGEQVGRMEETVGLVALVVVVPVKELLLGNLEKRQANCTQAAVVVVGKHLEQVAQAVAAQGDNLNKTGNRAMQILVVEAEARVPSRNNQLLFPVLLAALASCASGCTRRARERGKDNYAVIQERNEDGGIHSAVQQGAPQHRRHHNGTHTAPPGGGLGLAMGAGVLGLPVRATVAHIPAEDGAEKT